MNTNKASTIQEWLPLPSGVSGSPHHSFTEELLKQFDKKCNLIFNEQDTSDQSRRRSDHSSSSSSSSSVSLRDNRHSTHLDNNVSMTKGEEHTRNVNLESQGNHRRSAANLLRKSSLYLRSKFYDQQEPRVSLFHSWKRKKLGDETKLSKVAINTTIHIPQPNITLTPQQRPIQPPIITQYPPKPLHYSPVEPLPDDEVSHHHAGTRSKKLHRLSLPLLKFTAIQQYQHVQRRRSDSDLLQQETSPAPKSTSVLRSLSKKWNKLICRKS